MLGRLDAVRVVALTGSQGKTSTKDLLAQVLAAAGRTVATYGSFNNELGLPLTVLRADTATRYLVLEMGARHIGDLRYSCEIAQPEVSLVLNVGKAHIGEFGSQRGHRAGQGRDRRRARTRTAPRSSTPTTRWSPACGRAAAAVSSPSASTPTPTSGSPTCGSTTSAAPRSGWRTPASRKRSPWAWSGSTTPGTPRPPPGPRSPSGCRSTLVAEALRSATATSPGRMEVHERADGVTVIDDAYNANPDSMRAALKALAAIGRGRPGSRTLAVLGEMRELGASAREEHDAVGRLAVRLDIHQLLVVGEAAKSIHLGASLEGSWGGESVFVADADEAVGWLRRELVPGDVVLFKASNAVRLSSVAQAVLTSGEESSR